MRLVFSKNNAKKLVDKFDGKDIVTWLSIAPAMDILRELNLIEQLENSTSEVRDLSDFSDVIEDLLHMGLHEEFPVNQRIQNLKGKIGPFELMVPKTSKELFNAGIELKNCLTKMYQIQKYCDNQLFIALTFEERPVYGLEFSEQNGIVKCTQAKKAENETLEPAEFFIVAEATELIAKHLNMKAFNASTFQEGEDLDEILNQFKRMLDN
ncbi:MAG: hypothetical protein OHK0056_33410 [Bacteriovoracaceae bacterium]